MNVYLRTQLGSLSFCMYVQTFHLYPCKRKVNFRNSNLSALQVIFFLNKFLIKTAALCGWKEATATLLTWSNNERLTHCPDFQKCSKFKSLQLTQMLNVDYRVDHNIQHKTNSNHSPIQTNMLHNYDHTPGRGPYSTYYLLETI